MRKLLIALGLLLAIGAATAQAQREKPFIAEAFGMFMVPTGDFADQVKASPGFGAALGYYVSPQFLIGGQFSWAMMKAKDTALGLDEDVLNFFAFFGFDVTAAQPALSVVPFLGAGATMFRYDIGGSTESSTKPAINAGLLLYYWFTPSVGLVVGGAANLVFVGSDEGHDSSTKVLVPAKLGLALGF